MIIRLQKSVKTKSVILNGFEIKIEHSSYNIATITSNKAAASGIFPAATLAPIKNWYPTALHDVLFSRISALNRCTPSALLARNNSVCNN